MIGSIGCDVKIDFEILAREEPLLLRDELRRANPVARNF
jgi:hypothetical protein